ncbi:InlB B-repeat-containing protein [Candidatus Saccharibacteria bacterium]|nr:InlB B-repeat-containing protein [Candidatus Saccharibacteria bacterium]
MKRNNSMGAHIGLRGIVRIIRFTSVLSFVMLCGATIVPIYHETNNAEAATGTATAPTLTFTSTNATASVSLAINDVNGTFATSTEAQKAAFSIATNNYSGYTLNLTASGNTTTLNDDSSHIISSIDYDVSAADFASDTSLNNKWGFIPSHYSSAANTDDYYFPASTSSHSDTLMVTSTANSNNGIDNADNYTIGIGLRADYSTPSGTYTNSTFLIQYVVNPVEYTITYSNDGISGVSGLPAGQGGSVHNDTAAESITLSSTIPTRTGYTFAGWCLGSLSNDGTTCTGTTFAAGGEFGIDKTADNTGVTLKALWTVNTYAITFTFDNSRGVSSIVIKNAAGTDTVATVSTSGNSVNLAYGTTYTVVPTIDTSNGYELDAITLVSGEGTLNGVNSASYTVGDGIATINVAAVKTIVLYDEIAAMSKGKQTAADLQVNITAPTSSDPSIDTSNSGVYEYDPSVFGVASDASNDYKIFYYRGILDSTFTNTNNYGSSGDGAYYPNYVILDADGTKDTSDTCWRIVRTTGSGGIKMIYNGKWTGSTCANARSSAQAAATSVFNGGSSAYQQIVRVGYTYNGNYATDNASTETIANVLGSDSNISANNTDSAIKDYVEDAWFSNIGSFESKLETSAGYCNDRTVYNDISPYTLQSESTNIVTYGTSDMAILRFGANVRNFSPLSDNGNRTITLNCTRNTVDLYTVQGSTDGNGQMSKPIALLTADEASFAGSGSSTATQGSVYNASSFLRSGSGFWLLSPYDRGSNGMSHGCSLGMNGYLGHGVPTSTNGVRPVISLVHRATATSGSGTAADPWVVTP